MVPWWKRILYSLASVLIADCIGLAVLFAATIDQRRDTLRTISTRDGLAGILITLCFVLVYSTPGWLMALPAVIGLRNLDGRRSWICAVVGSWIGPAQMYGLAIYFSLRRNNARLMFPGPNPWFVTATVVSVSATVLYVGFMKRDTRN